jgi:hypothetical protein
MRVRNKEAYQAVTIHPLAEYGMASYADRRYVEEDL